MPVVLFEASVFKYIRPLSHGPFQSGSNPGSTHLGTTSLAICMFTSIHAFLSPDCGTLTGFLLLGMEG